MHRLGQYGVSIICVPSSWNIKFNLHISHFCFDDGGEGVWEIIYVFTHILRLRGKIVLSLFGKTT